MYNINQFKRLTFTGIASGAELTPLYDHSVIEGKYLVIKRIKVDYYFNFVADPGPQVPLPIAFANDTVTFAAGANTRYLLKPTGSIIDIKDFDRYQESGLATKEFLKLSINGSRLDIFTQNNSILPGVIDMDNLDLFYPEKITNQEISWRITKGLTYPDNSAAFFPRVIISMEVYSISNLLEIRQVEPVRSKSKFKYEL